MWPLWEEVSIYIRWRLAFSCQVKQEESLRDGRRRRYSSKETLVAGDQRVVAERPALVVEGTEQIRPACHEDDEEREEEQAGDLQSNKINN